MCVTSKMSALLEAAAGQETVSVRQGDSQKDERSVVGILSVQVAAAVAVAALSITIAVVCTSAVE
jgi:hypothetical protein